MIKNASANDIVWRGTTYPVGSQVCAVHIVDGSSVIVYDLPYGTYTITEINPPAGYHNNNDWSTTVNIRNDGAIIRDAFRNAVPDQIVRGNVIFKKVDNSRLVDTPQGDATFAGTTFTIYNESKNSVMYNGEEIPVGGIVAATRIVDDTGLAGVNGIPYGTYRVTETVEPFEGYEINTDYERWFTIRYEGEIIDLRTDEDVLDEQVMLGSMSLVKVDTDWLVNRAQGDASLFDATFAIYNASRYPIVTASELYETYREVNEHGRASVIIPEDAEPVAIVTTINNGYMEVKDLPYGTYILREIEAPTGYNINPTLARGIVFTIRENGGEAEFQDLDTFIYGGFLD